jgi:hypothetical protein
MRSLDPLMLRRREAASKHPKAFVQGYPSANFRSLIALKSCTPPPTRLVV